MKKKYNISYCSNIFKNNNLDSLFNSLSTYKNIYKKENISLCLSNKIITDLNKTQNIKKIVCWQNRNKKYITLINGFVYKKFHQNKIKENIYYPDWTKEERVNFTKKLIFFAQKINKEKKKCGISTLPITYKLWIKKNEKYNIKQCVNNLFKLIKILMQIKKYKKILIHIDIEPEPFCLLEKCEDFVIFFKSWILPGLINKIQSEIKIDKNDARKIITQHINLCFDSCHSAVMFENVKKSLNLIRKLKIKIGRIQVSSAIKIKNLTYQKIKQLEFLRSSPFLHQSIMKTTELKLIKQNDFKIKNMIIDNIKELRIHCHVPINKRKLSKDIYTTQKELKNYIYDVLINGDTKNLEIETYTYNIIYKNLNKTNSMIKENKWLTDLIEKIYG